MPGGLVHRRSPIDEASLDVPGPPGTEHSSGEALMEGHATRVQTPPFAAIRIELSTNKKWRGFLTRASEFTCRSTRSSADVML